MCTAVTATAPGGRRSEARTPHLHRSLRRCQQDTSSELPSVPQSQARPTAPGPRYGILAQVAFSHPGVRACLSLPTPQAVVTPVPRCVHIKPTSPWTHKFFSSFSPLKDDQKSFTGLFLWSRHLAAVSEPVFPSLPTEHVMHNRKPPLDRRRTRYIAVRSTGALQVFIKQQPYF